MATPYNSAVISAVDLIRGIGVYAGLEILKVPGATGLYDTNYEGKADAALAALKGVDFVYLHVEAPDEAGHDGNLDLKIRTIEDLDARLIGRILTGLEQQKMEAVVAVLIGSGLIQQSFRGAFIYISAAGVLLVLIWIVSMLIAFRRKGAAEFDKER